MELAGTTAFVTGGMGGIGQALTAAFQSAGMSVVTADLPGTGADVDLDVTDADATRRAIDELDQLDVVVANAGIAVGGLVDDIGRAEWDRCIEVNIRGVVNTVLPGYARLRQQGSGTIVLTASLAGLVGAPLLTPYGMSKAAVVGLGGGLRPEAARHGVNVITVCPGTIETPILDTPISTPGMSGRRYITAAGGKPVSPATLATKVVDALRSDKPMVVPGRAAVIWRLGRYLPWLADRELTRGMKKELETAARATR
jgi:NAD(P)-dependent dehydrogenase (short-subunit alcohol dehydrogenase family)